MKNVSMIRHNQKGSPMSAAELSKYANSGDWVTKHSVSRSSGPQTQLLFNLAMPGSVLNRATRAGPPAPIVIEKLIPHRERQDDGESCSSSLRLSVLSEDRLQAAVRLAKRDLHRKRQESINSHLSVDRSPSPEIQNNTANWHVLNDSSPKGKQRTSSPKRQTKSCSQVLVYTPQRFSVTTVPEGQSPPTRDPGLKDSRGDPLLSREIHKLQKELATYIQRIEQLANKGQMAETVEPDEKRRMEIRRQEQAARSARIIYVLQQQVKEIQEDIDKLRSQSARHTKKSRAVDRLAAAHRGAVRAMQVFINQLSDPTESRLPAQCKELGQLIRQLSLCSAKMEVGQGSAVPETTLDILQKLEILDTALSKQTGPEDREPRMRSASPARQRSLKTRAHSMSPPRVPWALAAKAHRGSRKSVAPKKTLTGKRVAGQPQRAAQFLKQERSEVLKAGIQSLMQQREQREQESKSRPELHTPNPATGAAYRDKSKQGTHVRDAGFQQPTVSSRLRESQLPQKEVSVPWIPTSPHSPTKQRRTVSSRPEPRCLFSPGKSSSEPTGVQPQGQGQGKNRTQQGVAAESMRQAHNEALRQAWLDRITEDRVRELNQLSKEETERINRLRTEVGSPTEWAERAEQAARERLQPLLDSVQVGEVQNKKGSSFKQRLLEQAVDKSAVNADLLSEAILEDLLEDTAAAVWAVERERGAEAQAHRLLQEPTLESMLLRMEEMEKDQEEVRRRFAMISYSDPLLWERDTRTRRKSNSSRPASPQPIRLTKPAPRPSTTGDIVLQNPVETGIVSESSLLDEESSAPIPSHPFPSQVENKGGVQLTVPSSMQKNIQKYREAHDSYLRLVSHEAVGSFNPWAVAESLAEELMEEALTDVAAEFQHVCEEYAEAIFTSEFLQPVQSPSLSVS
ncbi:protein moonraker isoform X3 [Colossoma macropomum]|uniref:protein moonraker isoform X3 n=1 Tax=Colossoma macropomum TaxID=42526 RepID=UPI001863BF51|nr:protein moonraker isoform X3 [Colossoma macropomum]